MNRENGGNVRNILPHLLWMYTLEAFRLKWIPMFDIDFLFSLAIFGGIYNIIICWKNVKKSLVLVIYFVWRNLVYGTHIIIIETELKSKRSYLKKFFIEEWSTQIKGDIFFRLKIK